MGVIQIYYTRLHCLPGYLLVGTNDIMFFFLSSKTLIFSRLLSQTDLLNSRNHVLQCLGAAPFFAKQQKTSKSSKCFCSISASIAHFKIILCGRTISHGGSGYIVILCGITVPISHIVVKPRHFAGFAYSCRVT